MRLLRRFAPRNDGEETATALILSGFPLSLRQAQSRRGNDARYDLRSLRFRAGQAPPLHAELAPFDNAHGLYGSALPGSGSDAEK